MKIQVEEIFVPFKNQRKIFEDCDCDTVLVKNIIKNR